MVEAYFRFSNALASWSGRVAGLSLVLIFLLVIIEIFMRSFIGRSTLIAEEMCGYLNVALVFFGISYALVKGGLIRVGILYATFRGGLRRFADWFTVLASLAYFLVILFYMGKRTIYSYEFNIISTNISLTPQYIPQMFIVAGSLIMILVLLGLVVDRCRRVP